ncbi:RagB/SusD family nutrient uptake outer membrane protein [Flavobacterium azooxidireducens]|uniref:RagB/SusD family nutrient uptake outer membrane protein n=1 Tax=Flavobacterium azooxidireducens TaxID=1871076 RepID=A0ABY4KFB5_9FLAO|nr:RagB/SusD family nutrient uptake outer membrane protein [Flavobacterium azooxidireducens]UPQ79494.1 RagB/SusD family nutrient uptake outer membrane protein [Flavobacterium azooxidireducens]
MKTIKIFLGLLVTMAFVQCSDDYLDKVPLDTISTGNYPTTEEELITVVNGAYQPLQWPKLYNLRMWTSDIFAGNSIVGAGGGQDGIETTNLSNFVTTTDNEGVLDLWRGPWPGILRANIVLAAAEGLTINENVKNRSMGEAYFLRAHYYFILVRFFGDVPLVTTPQNASSDLYPARTPKAEVYAQILSDLEKAVELLPVKQEYGDADKGRASKGAAMGMLAKVHLTLGNWSQVVTLTSGLEAMGYSLNTAYSDNFNPNTENSNESLFEVQYVANAGFDFWSNENQSSWTSTFMGPRSSGMVAGAYGWNQPTAEFMNNYEEGDVRKNTTVLYEGCPDFEGVEYSASYSLTGYNVRKFLVPQSIAPTYDNSPLNFPVMRYADVLLMKAEALNELGQTALAETPLNLVRNRAGLNDITGLSQGQFRMAVLKERRMELAFEGQRWFDLIRVNNGQYGIDFLHSIGKTNASQKHLLLPIPQIERDRNPNLTQNPGY